MKEVGGNCRGYVLSSNEKVEAVKQQKIIVRALLYATKGAGTTSEKRNLVVASLPPRRVCGQKERRSGNGAVLCGSD